MNSSSFYSTIENIQWYIEIAEGYDGREIIEELLNYLPKKSELLELGSGPGTDLHILREHYFATGSDNSQLFLDYVNSKYPQLDLILLDAITLEVGVKYDGIYSNKVLHHLTDSDLFESFKRQHEVMNMDGIICHTFWKGDGSEDIEGSIHNYHTEEEIQHLCGTDFIPLVLRTYKEMEEDDSILLIAKRI